MSTPQQTPAPAPAQPSTTTPPAPAPAPYTVERGSGVSVVWPTTDQQQG
ncbi:hypothetical protein ACWEO1_06330 [Kitasatospora cineracea]